MSPSALDLPRNSMGNLSLLHMPLKVCRAPVNRDEPIDEERVDCALGSLTVISLSPETATPEERPVH